MHHKPRKRFGQNFLQDTSIIHKIIQTLNLQPDDNVLEIGPGMGALTHALLPKLQQLICIEIDRDLASKLQDIPELKLINADVLATDFTQFGDKLRVVGNLPYNISTPLLFHLMQFLPQIHDMHFMLQKEVVDRITASPGSKQYGRLSVMIGYFCHADLLFEVPPQAFYPAPKVTSAIIRLIPHQTLEPVSIPLFTRVVQSAFAMRRKTLQNNLKLIMDPAQLATINIDGKLRPEQISIADYIAITRMIHGEPLVQKTPNSG